MFRTVSELVELAEKENIPISEVMIRQEMNVKDVTREEIFEQMENNLQVMEDAIEKSLAGVEWVTGMAGGDAVLVQKYIKINQTLSGELLLDAVSKAMETNEVNAARGTVCATPTAGSAGCLPGMLFAVKNSLNPTREEMIRYLLTSGAFGFVVANNAFISGATGGCQAEVGSAGAMASAAIVEMAGGRDRKSTRLNSSHVSISY